MSRFESRLLEAIRAEANETKKSVHQLALAAYRVRIGDSLAARSIVVDARARHLSDYNAQIFAHINFVEGLCEYFEQGIESAIPKLVRANALSNGCPIGDDLPALVKAWLAGLHRNLGNWRSMSEFLISAGNLHDHLSDEALSRLSLVAADALQEIESYSEATRWYSSAHRHALASGDDAALSAILYNRAAIRIFNSRIAEVDGKKVDVIDGQTALEAASADNYTRYIKDMSMRWGFDLMAGQIFLLKQDFSQALALLESERAGDLESQWPAVDLVRRADIFRCQVMLNQLEFNSVSNLADRIWARSHEISGFGDRAIAAYSLAEGLRRANNEAATVFQKRAQEALSAFNDERREEAIELSKFTAMAGSLLSAPSSPSSIQP